MPDRLLYLTLLLFSIIALATLDHRYKLALFYDWRRTARTLGLATLIFALWDVLGVLFGIFLVGPSPYVTGIRLGPEFPLEELFFLILLTYNTLLLWRGSEKIWPRT